jgi:hypothetical protein
MQLCVVQKNQCVVFMTGHGHKVCAIGHFVKFGGGNAMHCNCTMLEECIFVAITSCILVGVHFPYPEHDHDPPFHSWVYHFVALETHHKILVSICIFHICNR